MNPFKLRPGFLSHIAGLRGVAVGLVVLSHLGVPGFENGFIGVDIFFVISGFLITGIMAREYERNRTENQGFGFISLKHFYFRRAKRILPASLLVSIAILIYSWSTQNIFAFGKVLKDFWWATFFGANINFLQQSTDYFQQTNATSPFQHYWSLSIEEQFYFIWPTIFLMAVSFHAFHFRGRWVTWRQRAIFLVSAISAGSLTWMVIDFAFNPHDAYFSLATRGWELSTGSLSALALPFFQAKKSLQQVAAVFGIFTIVGSMILVTPTNFGYTLALPVLGSNLILIFAGSVAGHANPLNWAPLIFLGNISYSLYLWHWPIIVFGKGENTAPDLGHTVVLLSLALVLAALTFAFVEIPCQKINFSTLEAGSVQEPAFLQPWIRTLISASTALAVLAGPQVVIPLLSGLMAQDTEGVRISDYSSSSPKEKSSPNFTSALEKRSSAIKVALSKSSIELSKVAKTNLTQTLSIPLGATWYSTEGFTCSSNSAAPTAERCEIGSPNATKTYVMIGDSHSMMFRSALAEIVRTHPNIKFVNWAQSECPNSLVQIPESNFSYFSNKEALQNCNVFHQNLRGMAAKDVQSSVVILSDGGQKIFEGYVPGNLRLLKYLKGVASEVVTLGATPKYPVLSTCIGRNLSDLTKCVGKPVNSANIQALNALGAKTKFISTSPWFCTSGECPILIEDQVVSADGSHLTIESSRKLAAILIEALAIPAG